MDQMAQLWNSQQSQEKTAYKHFHGSAQRATYRLSQVAA